MPAEKKPSFYIIDGHAHIYRAYFAPFRDLTGPNGEPVKATYVFTQMLMNMVEQQRPDYLAVVIDTNEEQVFRKAFYPAYKANRPPKPDDFRPQEERILRIIEDAGVPILAAPGFEADDVIATMCEQLCDQYDVFIASKDKDLRQLLTDCVRMFDVFNGDTMGPVEMRAKLGYGPEQAIDVQTLIGDPIDNVPGIPKVGEKTAAALLNEFGSIEGIYANLDKLKSKKALVKNLTDHQGGLDLSRRLVTLRRDVPMTFDPQACKFNGFHAERLREHLEELNFRTLLNKLDEANPPPKAEPKYQPLGDLFSDVHPPAPKAKEERNYRLVNTPAAMAEMLAELNAAERIAFDTETTDTAPVNAELVGIALSTRPFTGWYVPVCCPVDEKVLPHDEIMAAIRPILEDATKPKLAHNAKYDLIVLHRHGIDVKGLQTDTMLAAFLLEANRFNYGMDSLARDLLNLEKIPTSDLIGKGRGQLTMNRVALERITQYACEDVDVTLRLADLLQPRMAREPQLQKLHDELELPLVQVLAEMELAGITVDPKVLEQQSIAMGKRIDTLRAEIIGKAGVEFNPDSPKQLADVLFNTLGLKKGKKTKTGYSTDVEVLEKLATEHEVPRLVLEHRQLVKLKNTYLDNLQTYLLADGRIHTSFNITGAATGRLSSSDPNLQNIPIRTDEGRQIRSAFVPPDKNRVLLTADYSQIELRVLAHLAEEPALIEAFNTGQDIHTAVASEVFGVSPEEVTREMRGKAKTINFGIIYGVTAFGLARRIEGLSQHAAAELIRAYNVRFPRVGQFMEECVAHARLHGYVQTIMGRRRPVTEIESRIQHLRGAAERIAINSVVQGSAADLIKQAMLNLHRRIHDEQLPMRMLLQVHDELVFETPREHAQAMAEEVRQGMTSAMSLKVPLAVETGFGENWQELK